MIITYLLLSLYIVYYVSEKGWTQVWAGDTTDMYYGYYPIERKLLGAEKKAEETK